MKREVYSLILTLIILFCLVLILFQNLGGIHARVAYTDTPSNVSIAKFFSIEFSSGLSEGIIFGNVNILPASNVNASHNYDGIGNASTLYINVSNDGNTAVDFCIMGDGGLSTLGGDVIGLGNETYSHYNFSNSTHPILNEISLTQVYTKSGENIPLGGENYWRFWLDIPAGQASGDYNNTVYFKAVETSASC